MRGPHVMVCISFCGLNRRIQGGNIVGVRPVMNVIDDKHQIAEQLSKLRKPITTHPKVDISLDRVLKLGHVAISVQEARAPDVRILVAACCVEVNRLAAELRYASAWVIDDMAAHT